jgi:16S rRNA (guanine966-N2)-methyltransferase
VLDLFAGTGALGLEALSRGAAHCLFVDTDPAARAALASNIEACSAQGITRVWKRDATDLGVMPATANGPFDLVFLDPPYAKGYDLAALKGLTQGWLHGQSLVMLERGRGEPALVAAGYNVLDSRTYGAAEVIFLTLSEVSA